MQGNFYGIGVSFFMHNDSVAIIRVLEGGPSEASGLLPGDRILIANEDTLFQKNYSSEKIMQTLKGRQGTPVNLTLYRRSEDRIIQVEMKRGVVPLPSVEAHYLVDQNTGYLKINRFSQTTYQEFKAAMEKLLSDGTEQLILDLRNNPGGYLFPAKKISNAFLKKDQTIVITQSNVGEEEKSLAKGDGFFQEGKLVVLVNEQSASASEIVAGAMQDNDRGWIIGRRTWFNNKCHWVRAMLSALPPQNILHLPVGPFKNPITVTEMPISRTSEIVTTLGKWPMQIKSPFPIV
jgi:carboxyl-terminal processing protease